MSDQSPDTTDDAASLRVTFNDMAYGGDAVGRDPESGLAVFAWPGIAGETAQVRVTSRRPKLLRGLVTEVEEASPERVEAPCPYFGPCGGCQWQHMSYGAQLAAKDLIVRSQLARLGGVEHVESVFREPVASPQPFGYRNSSQFALDTVSRTLAYHARGGHELVPVTLCPISNTGINRTIPAVNSMLAGALTEAEAGEERRGLMHATRIAIRSSERTGQTLVVFHTGAVSMRSGSRRGGASKWEGSRQEEPDMEVTTGKNPALLVSRREVKRVVRELGGRGQEKPLALTVLELMADGTINMLGETRASFALGSDAVAEVYTGALLGRLGGREAEQQAVREGPPPGSWIERLGDRLYWVAPQAFFQVNTEAADLLLAEVASHLPTRLGILLDAHAGVGTFAIHVADRCQQVIGFETERPSVHSAQWTARASGVKNSTFRVGRAEELLPRLPDTLKLDAVLLDPPRSGCHPRLLSEIARREVPLVLYVSCDPSTLARDIKLLSPSYRLASARVFDLFPQTYHIETVAVLTRKGE
jgi:23S rRNA (uracil1939-C5)-methyltransferase